MEKSSAVTRAARICGDESIEAGREPVQLGWYEVASRFGKGKIVLDAGCGLGAGMEILARVAKQAYGQDLDPRLESTNVRICTLGEIPSKSADVVVSIDVIEHVEADVDFVSQLARIAREGFFISTPNFTASRCQWEYHVREYTPRQLYNILSTFGAVTMFKGSAKGDSHFGVTHPEAYFLLNDLRVSQPTAFLAKCANYLLPGSHKIHNHNGAWVQIRR